MRRLALPLVLACLAVPATASAQDPAAPAPAASEPRIAAGISAQGVDLSGLTVAEAAAKLDAEEGLRKHLERDLILGVAGRPWRLKAETARLDLDAERTAKRALYAKAGTTEVPLAITHSLGRARAFVEAIRRRVSRRPRNATSRITLRRVSIRRARRGRTLDTDKARKMVSAALEDGTASRVLHLALTKISPAVNANHLNRRLRTVITVDKRNFKLRLFKNRKVVKTYGVATGLPAYPTPSGLFSVTSKQVNPTWSVPNSPWAGELAGTTVRGGSAANPLKARWMGIVNGVGFHGTAQSGSIGSRASHGCLRMHVRDIIALYPRVPVGTPVLLK